MPLVVTSVPNLAQGVSQQPDNLRYPGQCDEQVNAWATVVEGLVKRPNTRWVKEFNNSNVEDVNKSTPTPPGNPSNLFTHFVKRDESNKYCVQVSLGGGTPSLGVINLRTGASIPVATTSSAQSYLNGITNPLADLRALTVADYTFLVNKKKTVQVETDADTISKDVRNDDGEYEALVFVKLGDYEKTYNIYLDGKEVPHATSFNGVNIQSNSTPPNGHTYESGSSHAGGSQTGEHADTELIAEDLEIILKAYVGSAGIVNGISITGSTNLEDTKSTPPYAYSIQARRISYEFFIEQYQDDPAQPGIQPDLSNKIGYGAKGTLVISGGAVQSYNLTHQGTGYDNTQTTPGIFDNPFVFTIRQHKFIGASPGIQKGSSETTVTDYSDNVAYPGILLPSATPTVPASGTNYSIDRQGAVIRITGTSDFSIRTEDGLANEGLGVAYKEVASITDLPKKCFNRFKIKVRGDADIDQDDYYVMFQTKDREDYGEGSWVEIVGWRGGVESAKEVKGIKTTIKNTTMPIVLVVDSYDSEGNINSLTLQSPNEYANVVKNGGTFYNLIEDHISSAATEPGSSTDSNGDGVEDWKEYWVETTAVTSANNWVTDKNYQIIGSGYAPRQAGDDSTNPFPSFVGSTINDVFFFKNRLGFLTDSAVVFSEADEYFNFFRTTTQQLLDSAPIDVGISHTKVAVLQHALPFQEKLMLFSDNSQFVLRGADVLSPKTVAISPVTEYDISDGIAPLALGPYIYFPFNRGQFEGMFEYFVDNNTEVFEAEEITSQIPKYIPSSIKRMAGSASESMVLLQDDTNQNLLYVYKYFWSGKEKIQSAWQKWEFADNVTGFDFIDSTLYLILDGKTLVEMPVENALTDEGLDYTLLLDNRVDGVRDYNNDTIPDLSVSYDSLNNETTISNLPDGYGVEVTTDVDGNVTSTNVAVYTKGGSGRTVSGSGASTTVKIDGFIASYVDNGGDYVEYDGDYYYCIISHTSASTFESKYWRKAAYPPSGTPDWSASTSYSKGTIYKCETNHTSPSTFAVVDTSVTPNVTYWSVSTDVPSAPEWTSNIFYNNDRYFVVGKPYNMLYRFSNQALKQPTERGGRSASDYTYQTIRNASIEYADTGHFTVEVTPRFRDKYTYVYNPALLSSISTLDRFTPESGHFRFGVQCRPEEATIEVKSSSALPVKLLAAEFESMVTGRSRRYGA